MTTVNHQSEKKLTINPSVQKCEQFDQLLAAEMKA